MKINIFQTFANTSVCSTNKSLGFSITYAIVALVVVGVVLAGLTPVLTRKLPNLSTSSIIKNPKGWYESFNAPISGKYCSKCKEEDEKYNDCLKEKEKNPNSNKECKDPWPNITIKYDENISTNNECFGNPACIPYINPDDLDDKHIVPFEQYCKSNGKCKPDPDTPDNDIKIDDITARDLCQKANYWNQTKKEYGTSNPKPCPCPKGKCKFKPQTGITKYEVYAIGGGGGSGSAVASKPSGKGKTYEESVVGHPKKNLAELPNSDLKTPASPSEKETLLHNLNYPKTNEVYPNADFIDQNRIDTKNNPYKPDDFSAFSNKEDNPNILGDFNTKCATGIIYTVGKENNNFHTYPTEDSNHKLAEASKRQIKKILGNKTYKIGERNVYYYDRYYLYTRYLGAYAYNQNPVYLLMPEWVKVDNLDKKFPSGKNSIDITEELLEKEGIDKKEVTCIGQDKIPYTCFDKNNKKKICYSDCNISYIIPKDFPEKKHTSADSPKAILSNYSTIAAVACSGDGSNGANVIAKKRAGSESCGWMKPTACRFFINDLETTQVEGSIKDIDGDDPYACPHSSDGFKMPPKCWAGVSNPPVYDENDKVIGLHCVYTVMYKNRHCVYQDYINSYVTCNCPKKDIPPNCETNDDAIGLCTNTKVEVLPDPNLEEQASNLAKYFQENTEDAITNTFTLSNNSGDSITYSVTDGGQIYAVDPVKGYNSYFGKVEPLRNALTGETNEMTEAKAQEILNQASNFFNKYFKNKATDLSALTDLGGGIPHCILNKDYVRNAYGGAKGKGVCGYKISPIIRNKIDSIEIFQEVDDEKKPCLSGQGLNANNVGIHNGCGSRTSGNTGQKVFACINKDCANIGGGLGGQGGIVNCPVCTGSASNGEKGGDGSVSNGGYFSKKDRSSSYKNPLKYDNNALAISISLNSTNNKNTSNSKTKNNNVSVNKNMNGTLKTPGRYNYRYIWYMPFVTKHLMFGLAGEGGEEVHSLVTLSEGQTLEVTPGKGAVKTIYTSGANGGNGEQSEVRNDDAKVKIVAHGGKGGLGSQKTDEYALCHISDLQNQNPNLPCFYKSSELNDFKSTHAYDIVTGKFVGILATQPKISTTVNSIKMSTHLKQGTPGMGAMGFGTKSVSDVICNKRHVAKWDEIEGTDTATAKLLSSGGNLYNICKGNSKIKYIIPNGSGYTAGTGAVIIIW